MSHPSEYTCPICGKLFINRNPAGWAYKRRDCRKDSRTYKWLLHFCSASCARQFDKLYPHKTYNTV